MQLIPNFPAQSRNRRVVETRRKVTRLRIPQPLYLLVLLFHIPGILHFGLNRCHNVLNHTLAQLHGQPLR